MQQKKFSQMDNGSALNDIDAVTINTMFVAGANSTENEQKSMQSLDVNSKGGKDNENQKMNAFLNL